MVRCDNDLSVLASAKLCLSEFKHLVKDAELTYEMYGKLLRFVVEAVLAVMLELVEVFPGGLVDYEIGRASCRERV